MKLMQIRGASVSLQLCRRVVCAVVGASAFWITGAMAAQAHAQSVPVHTGVARPKIGLVLNGGGALGLAHVGVLQWLEEHHIPVDMISGTSMGGLVGGAYATGRNAEQVRQLVDTINWNKMLADNIPYRDLSFRRKQDEAEYPVDVQFGLSLKRGLRSQEGYKSGQQVQLLLDKMVLPYSEVNNFNDLPIPFNCVATDLVSGKEHVFRSGSLSMAMRATMSLPGIFAPVRTPDAIYADGSLVDNLPVQVAKDMGANITLAVYLQSAPIKPSENLSAVGVLGRGLAVMIAANELKSMQQADVLVSVPLENFNTLDYGKVDELIKAGYDAAASKAVILEKLSVDDATWQEYLQQRSKRTRSLPVPQYVEVSGLGKDSIAQVKRELAGDVKRPIQPDVVARQLTAISGNDRAANLSYGLTTNASGEAGLAVTGKEDVYGQNVVRPLIVVDGWDYKNVTLSVGARFTLLDLGRYGAELRSDVLVGSSYQISSEYYWPFTQARHWFLAPQLSAGNVPLNIYSEKGLVAEYRNRELGGAGDIGYNTGRSAEIRLGYEASQQRLYPNVGDPLLYPRVHGRQGNTHLRFTLDTLDNPITPMSGLRLQGREEWWDAKPEAGESFPLAELSAIGFKHLTNVSSAYLSAAGGSTLWKNPGGLPPFSLGGSFHLPAYGTNELLTNQYFLFQGGYLRKIGSLSPLVGGKVLLFAGADVGKAYYIRGESRLPSDGAAGVIINTLFGPVVMGASVGDTGHYKLFFELGRSYF